MVSGQRPVEGYSDIPDPKWLRFERNEVILGPDETGEIKMYLDVPNHDGYYNQHWMIGIGVKGKPKEGEAIALAVYPKYFVETESKPDLLDKPYGLTGIRPSIITLVDVPLSENRKMAQIELFNNDIEPHQYRIGAFLPMNGYEKGILISPSYQWVPDPNWVILEDHELIIEGGTSKSLLVGLNIPEEKRNYGKMWESLLMIRPDRGQPQFARIRINTKR